ncbi:stage VI sporulation protein D [Neobacillus sp. SM06]
MSQENQSCLRFSLEESLWFRKGQEVEELISISLDPDITIQENDQYVTIRGSLELTGEYKSFHDGEGMEEEAEFAQKYVQRVDEGDEGVYEFAHRFPVDITIPNNRIQSIYDIDVMVETFDYSLPERSCLKLSAELTISGLYGARQDQGDEVEAVFANASRLAEDSVSEKAAEETAEASSVEEQERPLFVVEARKPLEDESSRETVSYPTFSYQPQGKPVVQPAFTQFSDFSQPDRGEEKPKIEVVAEEVKDEVEVNEAEETEEIEIEEKETDEESSSSSSSDEGPVSKLTDAIKKKVTKKKSMSLTEFFARKEDRDEQQAKLKICIVQKGETLDQIAERYDVTFQNLLRVNRLEVNQDVYEGQVLYIPTAFAKK